MLELLEDITVDAQQVRYIQQLLEYTAETFAENNDGQEIMNRIKTVYETYRTKPLPQTSEFENRARLFQFTIVSVIHSSQSGLCQITTR